MPWFGRGERRTEDAPVAPVRRCPNASACPLFERFRASPALRVWQRFFCESSFERCARFGRMQCGDEVAATLLPDGTYLDQES